MTDSSIRATDALMKRAAEREKPGGSTPQQYGLPPGATELQDLIEYREMNFALGNIFKACYRRGTCSHSDELRDMRKIAWFAQREIERLEKETMAEALSATPASYNLDSIVSLDELAEDEEARKVFQKAQE